MKFLLCKILLIIFGSGLIFSVNSQTIREEIQSKVNIQFGDIYLISDIQNVEENRDNYLENKLDFNDPYGTLKDCYIFLATSNNPNGSVKPNGFIGIFRDGQIIWNSGSIIYTDWIEDEEIKGTLELNNDGRVEIITSWKRGMQGTDKEIWIYSWDGNNGYLLNDTSEEGGESVIWTFSEQINLIDIEGDGILEIIGVEYYNNYSDDEVPKIYSWNGTNYGDYGVPVPQFVPMNLCTAEVSCEVERSLYGLLFNYRIRSDSTSKQLIWKFAVEKHFDLVFAGSEPPNNKWNDYWDDNLELFLWEVNTDFQKYPFDFIEPGEERSGFKLEAQTPIIYIGKFYIQGKNGSKPHDDLYILVNSVTGKTICGKYPPDPFNPSDFLDSLLNYNHQSFELNWIRNRSAHDKYDSLFSTAKTQLGQKNISEVQNILQTVLHEVDQDSAASLTSEAYALLRYNTEYLLENLTEEDVGLNIRLINSGGNLLTGGSLKYYEGGWKDAVDNGDGTFRVVTESPFVSLRMTYGYASQTVSNVPVQGNIYTFRTINVSVQLLNSQGNLVNEDAIVKYYAGGWRDFGTTVNGIASKELLPDNYSFRMTYAYASNDKQQDVGTDPAVVFQTVNTTVRLQNSSGNLIDEGTVKYYAGGWRDFGATVNGIASRELLPDNYSFRMTYAYASNDKKQDIGADPVVVFQTINTQVQLQNSTGNLIDEGEVKYYAGGWRDFGTTVNGIASKELLPNNYSFRMIYAYVSNDKKQNVGTDPAVVFQTVNTTVRLMNSSGNLIDEGNVKYYAGGWRAFGATVNGIASRELLPDNYSFRMTYEFISDDKKQDTGTDPAVNFSTVLCTVKVVNQQQEPLNNADVRYYAGGWRQIGSTVNGEITKELLPKEITFRAVYGSVQQNKVQDISENNIVEIILDVNK